MTEQFPDRQDAISPAGELITQPETLSLAEQIELVENIETVSQALSLMESNGVMRQNQSLNIFPRDSLSTLDPAVLRTHYPRRYDLFQSFAELKVTDPEELAITMMEQLSDEQQSDILSWLRMMNGLDSYLILEEEKMSRWIANGRREDDPDKPTLKEKQLEVFGIIREKIELGHMAGYVKLPTGVGKTVLFTELVEASGGGQTVIVVPTIDLLDQTEAAFSSFAEDIQVDKIWGASKKRASNVVVITIDSLSSAIEKGLIDPAQVTMLILDEAHRYLTDDRVDAVSQFTKALKIGFTATPAFNDEKNVEKKILPEKFFGMDISEAIGLELVSSFRNIVVRTSADFSTIAVGKDGTVNAQAAEARLNTDLLNAQAVSLYEQFGNGETAVANCASLAHAEAIAASFRSKNITAEVIKGEMSKDERSALKARVEAGDVQVLCGDQLTIEGLDIKRIGICLNLAPTWSRVVCEQRAGRALRLYEGIPCKRIIDCIPAKYPPNQRPHIFADIAGRAAIDTPTYAAAKAKSVTTNLAEVPAVPFTLLGATIVTEPEEVMMIVTPSQARETLERSITAIRPKIMEAIAGRKRSIAEPTLLQLLYGNTDFINHTELAFRSGKAFQDRVAQEQTKEKPFKSFTRFRGDDLPAYDLDYLRVAIRQEVLQHLLPLFKGTSAMPAMEKLFQELKRLEGLPAEENSYHHFVEALFYLQSQQKETPVLEDIVSELISNHPFAKQFRNLFP